jgi:hypothetical protein
VNDGAKENCPRCSRDNHKLADCIARRHMDVTVLHIVGNIKECDEKVSAYFSTTFNICCDSELEELRFIQLHICSPLDK